MPHEHELQRNMRYWIIYACTAVVMHDLRNVQAHSDWEGVNVGTQGDAGAAGAQGGNDAGAGHPFAEGDSERLEFPLQVCGGARLLEG